MGRQHRSAVTGWRRLGGFRSIAVLVLALGATGGVYLGVNRQHQQTDLADEAQYTVRAQVESVDQFRLYRQKVRTNEATRAAQQKAAAAAAAAAVKAKAAAERARKQKASRSQQRSTPTTKAPRSTPPTRKPTGPGGGSAGPTPASCRAYTANRAIGCTLLLQAGFKLDQMPCLDRLWTKESGWTTTAENKSSKAYGIPQALPASKMSKYGSDYRTNPVPQIKWGLGYIKGRYGTPCGGWAYFQSHGWY